MLLGQLIQISSKDKLTLFDINEGVSVTLEELNRKVTGVISYLENSVGYKDGERIAIFMENSADYITILLALFELDVVIVPLNPKLNKTKLEYFLKHSESNSLIVSQEILNKCLWLKELDCKIMVADEIIELSAKLRGQKVLSKRKRFCEEGLKFIFYTSGTTDNPKGVMLSGLTIKTKILTLIELLKLNPGLSFFSFLPFHSGHGMIPGMLVPLLSGCSVYVGSFDAFMVPKFWELIEKYKINYFTSVPSILSLIKDQAQRESIGRISGLSNIFSASAPLPQNIFDWYYDCLGIKIRNCYGLTEVSSWISVNLEDYSQKSTCVGRAIDCEIIVFDEKGEKLISGETGELWVKGTCNMIGYYNNDEETRRTIVNGYVRTGDMGYIDPNCNIYILDRIKNIVKRGGLTICPLEVDQVFLEHLNVNESVTFGIPDKDYGEKLITALVVRDKSCSKDEYSRFAMHKLPTFLVPNDIFFVDNINKGLTGKILIDDLRSQYINRK